MHRSGRLPAALLSMAVLVVTASEAWAQQVQTFEGFLTVVWGDPPPGEAGGETRYVLALPDGRTASLQLAGQDNAALFNFGRRVIVTGRAAVAPLVAAADPADAGTLIVDSITRSAIQDFFTPNAVTGSRRVIYLLARFSDDAAVPHPPSFFTNLNNPDTPPVGELFPATVNGFFKKTSYNQFSWMGDVGGVGGIGASGGWLTLPNPKSYYAPCGFSSSCALLETLANDAMALGRAQGIDFRNYDNVNIVLSNDLDCCAWGGGFFSSVDNKVYGMTWEPPWGQETGTYAHEMGHSLGLPHSGWVYSSYDSPWDVMSSIQSPVSTICGSYFSRNSGANRNLTCTEPGDGYIAPHKDTLGWIPLANQVTVNPSSIMTVTLEANALPLASAVKMIKVCLPGFACTGNTARYLTVEARVRGLGATSRYDNGLPGEGIVIHDVRIDRPAISGTCFFNNSSGWAMPIDSTPGDWSGAPACNTGGRTYPNYALFNAQWNAGQTYTNSSYGLSVSVLSRNGSQFAVRVVNSATPVITAHPASQTIESGQTASLSVTAGGASPFTYQWYQGQAGATNAPVAGATSSSYTTGPRSSTAKYWVRVSNLAGNTDSDAATITVAFTDNTLTEGLTIIRMVHLIELRSRISALRLRFGLGAFSWTEATAGVTYVRAVHITELRSALAQAYSAAGRSQPTFTDPTLTPGVTTIRRAHVEELRTAVHALEEG